jgi:hypothetical protein
MGSKSNNFHIFLDVLRESFICFLTILVILCIIGFFYCILQVVDFAGPIMGLITLVVFVCIQTLINNIGE